MDHYGSMPAPGVEERRKIASQDVPQFHHLRLFDSFVVQAVDEVNPGSYAGYYVFARSEIERCVIQQCTKHVIQKKWALLLRCKRIARGLRARVVASYVPGGRMYNVIAKRTLIGVEKSTLGETLTLG